MQLTPRNRQLYLPTPTPTIHLSFYLNKVHLELKKGASLCGFLCKLGQFGSSARDKYANRGSPFSFLLLFQGFAIRALSLD